MAMAPNPSSVGYDISDFHDIDPLFGSMQVGTGASEVEVSHDNMMITWWYHDNMFDKFRKHQETSGNHVL